MRIKIGTKTIFHEVNATLDSNIPFKEVASKDTTGVVSTPGTQAWGLSCNTLIANSAAGAQEDIASLYAAHVAKTLVTVQFSTDVTGDVVFSGSVYIEKFTLDSTHEEEVKGDFSFKGDGALTIGTVA